MTLAIRCNLTAVTGGDCAHFKGLVQQENQELQDQLDAIADIVGPVDERR